MWNNHTKTQYQEQIKDTEFQKKHAKKLEMLIEGFGLITNVIFVDKLIQKSNRTTSKVKDIFVDTNAILNIVRKFYLQMNIMLGRAGLLKLPRLAEEEKSIRNGNKKYSNAIDFFVYGVGATKDWKPTILKDGVSTQNCVTSYLMEELSV